MQIKENKYKIPIDTYGAVIQLVLTNNVYLTAVKFAKKLKLEKEEIQEIEQDEDTEAYHIIDYKNVGNYYIICSQEVEDKFIVHETGHCTFHILKSCGVSMEHDDEPFCYLHMEIFDKVQSRIKKLKEKNARDSINQRPLPSKLPL